MNDLWFVHDIVSVNEKTDLAVLFYLKEADLYDGQDQILETAFLEIAKGYDKRVGTFVRRGKHELEPANSELLAKRAFFLSNLYRGLLLKRYQESDLKKIHNITIEYSYHINVGHGNCSILVARAGNQYEMWMVDCSNHDCRNQQNYTANIEKAISHIKAKFNLSSFHLDKFFLTHYHYDHYSGIKWLISNGHISTTEVWMNFHYSWPEPKFIRLLIDLNQMDCSFHEPKESNTIDGINIWHPAETIIRNLTPKYKGIPNVRVENKPNNSSAVFQLGKNGQTIVFPGDIETSGLDRIKKCQTHLNNAEFYCVSHHGSKNGHDRNACPLGQSITNMRMCCRGVSKVILMGRDGAHPGIYSRQVIQDFGNKLVYSEKDTNNQAAAFVELDFASSHATHYY